MSIKRVSSATWIVPGRTSNGFHVVYCDDEGNLRCTCPGYSFHGKCRHVRAVSVIYKPPCPNTGGANMVESYQTGFKFVDNLIGGFRPTVIYGIFGESQVGKTLTSLHFAYALSEAMGKNILLIDTEGGLEEFVEAWDKKLRSRFDAGEVLIETKRSILSVMRFFGYKIKFKTSDRGKMTLQLLDMDEEAPVETIIKKNNIGVIVIDSLTAPLRIFPSATENFPVRSDVTGLWLAKLQDIIEKYRVIVLVTHHESLNPQNPYADPNLRGGMIVRYLTKVIFYIERYNSKKLKVNLRKFWLMRYFDKPEWGAMSVYKITDVGVQDLTEDELRVIGQKR